MPLSLWMDNKNQGYYAELYPHVKAVSINFSLEVLLWEGGLLVEGLFSLTSVKASSNFYSAKHVHQGNYETKYLCWTYMERWGFVNMLKFH